MVDLLQIISVPRNSQNLCNSSRVVVIGVEVCKISEQQSFLDVRRTVEGGYVQIYREMSRF